MSIIIRFADWDHFVQYMCEGRKTRTTNNQILLLNHHLGALKSNDWEQAVLQIGLEQISENIRVLVSDQSFFMTILIRCA
jgi:hypothetical protein